jgi:hypothetical protein
VTGHSNDHKPRSTDGPRPFCSPRTSFASRGPLSGRSTATTASRFVNQTANPNVRFDSSAAPGRAKHRLSNGTTAPARRREEFDVERGGGRSRATFSRSGRGAGVALRREHHRTGNFTDISENRPASSHRRPPASTPSSEPSGRTNTDGRRRRSPACNRVVSEAAARRRPQRASPCQAFGRHCDSRNGSRELDAGHLREPAVPAGAGLTKPAGGGLALLVHSILELAGSDCHRLSSPTCIRAGRICGTSRIRLDRQSSIETPTA